MTLPSLLRFIVILREPVSRAISSYWFKGGKSVRQGEAMLTAQMEDVKRAERCVHEGGTVIACGADGRGAAFATYDHVSKSVYAPQLRRWFDTFGGPCPFYVTTLERLYTRGNDVASVQLRQLLAWAGVPPSATLAEPEIRAVLAERRGTTLTRRRSPTASAIGSAPSSSRTTCSSRRSSVAACSRTGTPRTRMASARADGDGWARSTRRYCRLVKPVHYRWVRTCTSAVFSVTSCAMFNTQRKLRLL